MSESYSWFEARDRAMREGLVLEFVTGYNDNIFQVTIMPDGNFDSIRTYSDPPAFWHNLDELTDVEKDFLNVFETLKYIYLWAPEVD